MKVKIGKHTSDRTANRLKKKIRIRKTVQGTEERPRLCIYRSNKNVYAQVINDSKGMTLVSTSSLKMEGVTGVEMAKKVGQEVAKAALAKNIKNVVFDRNGYIYHGQVKALADGAREGGLNF
ncbi:MAG: 50S ribosomal protein L18 [Bdellovibrionaceae bacterium]|nr:50S ribosomal protein L18 [Pseudobdellovibrionaceae bacterium]MBX3032415.1 50S ribosomal protein L18 [Pseudobdellovibrionaceae bacterium]